MVLPILLGWVHTQTAYDAIHVLDREIGFGSRALAMGSAYTALANDYTAIYWNPAGLTSVRRGGFFAEISRLSFSNEALFANKLTTHNQIYVRLRSIGVTLPIPTVRGSFVVAFGFNRVVDFDENLLFSGFSQQENGLGFTIGDENLPPEFYPFNKNVFRSEKVTSEGGIDQLSLGFGIAVSSCATLGLTLSRIRGEENYNFLFRQKDINDQYNEYPGNFEDYSVTQGLDITHEAQNLKVGGIVQLSRGFNIGATLTLPSRYHIGENHSSVDELTFDDGFQIDTTNSGYWDYRIKSPLHFDAGFSYSHRPFTVAISARYRDWSKTRFDLSRRSSSDLDYQRMAMENDRIRENYRPTLEYHVGGEVRLRLSHILPVELRGGYAFYPSPLSGKSHHNEERKYFTGGIGLAILTNISLDITYLHGTWQRKSSDNFTPSITQEDIVASKLLIGFSFNP